MTKSYTDENGQEWIPYNRQDSPDYITMVKKPKPEPSEMKKWLDKAFWCESIEPRIHKRCAEDACRKMLQVAEAWSATGNNKYYCVQELLKHLKEWVEGKK